jgi:hypothetical protein
MSLLVFITLNPICTLCIASTVGSTILFGFCKLPFHRRTILFLINVRVSDWSLIVSMENEIVMFHFTFLKLSFFTFEEGKSMHVYHENPGGDIKGKLHARHISYLHISALHTNSILIGSNYLHLFASCDPRINCRFCCLDSVVSSKILNSGT